MKSVAESTIPKDNLTQSLDGIRDALNNFNSALTGAKFDEGTKKMTAGAKASLTEVAKDIKDLTTSVDGFDTKMTKADIKADQSERIVNASRAFGK